MKATKAVIFDLDGTLVDTVALNSAAWSATFLRHGRYVPEEQIRPLIGTSVSRIVIGCFDKHADDSEIKELAREKAALYLSKIAQTGKTILFPGVEDTLVSIVRKGVKIGIGSANNRKSLDATTAATGLSELVDVSVSVEDVNNVGKPNPDIFLEVARRLSAEPGESAVVGDADSDMEAGKRGKMGLMIQFISKEWQKPSEKADFHIKRFNQITGLLHIENM